MKTLDVFHLRQRLIGDYRAYSESFIKVRDPRISQYVREQLESGALWPAPLIQLNPQFRPGKTVKQLADEGILHPLCADIFRFRKGPDNQVGVLGPLHTHQSEAVEAAQTGDNYVLITGTGSGKSLSYIIPIVDYALKNKHQPGIKAVVVYPMNALANSQEGELEKFLDYGPYSERPVTFDMYTGQQGDEERKRMQANPPDILLTNYVMLDLILQRPDDHPMVRHMQGMQFLVLDELHTYRGRQGADVAMLVRRVRDLANNPEMQIVGTSATLAGGEAGEEAPTFAEQQQEVAAVASKIFGTPVKPERVIGETLERTTPDREPTADELRQRLSAGVTPPASRDEFINDPLSIWIESTFGLEREPGTGRLRRARPISVERAAERLSQLTGVSEEQCAGAIRETFKAGYELGDKAVFAFRLHQFVSRGDTVYASVEDTATRHISLSGQKYAPGDRSRLMLPLSFCRECGQEYYTVTRKVSDSGVYYEERELRDQLKGTSTVQRGFLYRNPDNMWRDDDDEYVLDNVPDAWIQEGSDGRRRLSPSSKKRLPRPVRVTPSGKEGQQGTLFHFIPTPFNFCLNCGVSYHHTIRSDYTKLSSLSAGGRSTATTVLALSALRTMRQEDYLERKAQKLLSFTDNRQDASLQAGHTNDFVEVGLLRAAIYQAVDDAGVDGLEHDQLPQKVFKALNLPFELYASDPTVLPFAREEHHRALRNVLGYRIFQDLRRGWRVTAPNLEQTGLLRIEYKHLGDLAAADELWDECHPALATASAGTREAVLHTLLDYLRRELAIKVDFLDPIFQEQIAQKSYQYLVEPWAIDENERNSMTTSTVAFPCTQSAITGKRRYGNIYVSEYGGFGYYLRRPSTFPEHTGYLKLEDAERMIREIFDLLRRAALVEQVQEAEVEGGVMPGYQVKAGSFIWKAGDGTEQHRDPIRVPRAPEGGSKSNPFFVEFYTQVARNLTTVRAREHTAQVTMEARREREEQFRKGELPILYCSPTMELGVDISQLNVVNMRNVPPTPANYAQRSGRAGRSGQPALVFTYCTTGSPHDQYHFKRQERMVFGAVSTPRLDMTNEDLIRAHIHAIWLAETTANLGQSLSDVLDVTKPDELPIRNKVLQQLNNPKALARARARAERILATIADELADAPWYDEGWLDREMALPALLGKFEDATQRWKGLFLAAREQQRVQNNIASDASRSPADRKLAQRLREEAERQLSLLVDDASVFQGDFYSYRYFASEGFLPGYSFPRLPISAYIEGRRGSRNGNQDFLSRSRFLAISEFGPRAIIYHEGSRYIINKVILPAAETAEDELIVTTTAYLCPTCGYLHEVDGDHNPDVCERCGSQLGSGLLPDMFEMQNVATKRRDRISSDEEERLRQGYDIVSGVRFSKYGQEERRAEVMNTAGESAWTLEYGNAATIWRINRGWSRRANPNDMGFLLDAERGYWQRNQNVDETDQPDEEDPMSQRVVRVIPFVRDHVNAMLLEPAGETWAKYDLDKDTIVSLQAALQKAIQAVYQLEDNELSVEPLPSADEPRLILMYESSEGGAGVLRRLVDEPDAMARVAKEALRICHFDPDTGDDLKRAPGADEDCEAACYDCLLSYYNQIHHRDLDRHLIRDILMEIAGSVAKTSPKMTTRAAHVQELNNLCGSELERKWLRMVDEANLRLPDAGQRLVAEAGVRPDFFYEGTATSLPVAVFIDGPPHDDPEQRVKDEENNAKLLARGIEPLRFHHKDDWGAIFAERADIFGKGH